MLLTAMISFAATALALPTRINDPSREIPMLAGQVSAPSLLSFFEAPKNDPKEAISPTHTAKVHDPALEAELDVWLSQQRNRSFSYILENIGGVSTVLSPEEVSPGVVVASPSKEHPNYFFYWVRDAALTIRTLVEEFSTASGDYAAKLKWVIEQYIQSNYHLQRLPNRSGTFDDDVRSGLGEPKFLPNNTQFQENWGRPQSDGPALRASTIYYYLNVLENSGQSIDNEFLGNSTFIYEQMVRPDLEYVMASWKNPAFDLWEEINSVHFFNAMVQLKGLEDGIAMAKAHGDSATFVNALTRNYNEIKAFIKSETTGFVSPGVNHVIETPSLFKEGKRSGLDAAVLLAALHAHDGTVSESSDVPFDVDDIHILNSITSMANDMIGRYEINRDKLQLQQPVGVALGRYPEDIYDGYEQTGNGNPWFISVASAAEVLYRLIDKTVGSQKDILVTEENRDFYSMFVDDLHRRNAEEYVIFYGTKEYNRVMESIFGYADTFLQVVREHVDQDHGRMSEQFNRDGGYMQGAHDLTWSYCSLVEAVKRRAIAQEHLVK